MMMVKNRFGVTLMIFVFLLSFLVPPYIAAAKVADVSGTSYIGLPLKDEPLYYKQLEMKLINEINKAKGQGQYFYVGVAKENGTPLQSLCSRQGAVKDRYLDRCTRSDHQADLKAEGAQYGAKLMTVFYAKSIMSESEICGIEKRLIQTYRYVKKDPLCLNESPGHEQCCIQSYRGIVYLRIYN